MLGVFIFGLLGLSLLLAARKLYEHYQAHFDVESEAWKTYQIALRDELARFSSRAASAAEVRAFEAREQAYVQRLECQYARGVFADDIERRRAEAREQRRALKVVQTYDALRRDAS